MAGFDLVIHREVDAGNGTVPNVMVTLAVTHKRASVLTQNVPHLFLVFCHYAVIPTLFSNRKLSFDAGF